MVSNFSILESVLEAGLRKKKALFAGTYIKLLQLLLFVFFQCVAIKRYKHNVQRVKKTDK